MRGAAVDEELVIGCFSGHRLVPYRASTGGFLSAAMRSCPVAAM